MQGKKPSSSTMTDRMTRGPSCSPLPFEYLLHQRMPNRRLKKSAPLSLRRLGSAITRCVLPVPTRHANHRVPLPFGLGKTARFSLHGFGCLHVSSVPRRKGPSGTALCLRRQSACGSGSPIQARALCAVPEKERTSLAGAKSGVLWKEERESSPERVHDPRLPLGAATCCQPSVAVATTGRTVDCLVLRQIVGQSFIRIIV